MFKSLIAFCLSRRADCGGGAAVVCRRRVRCFQDAQYRGVSEPNAGDPGNHRAGAGPLRRGDGALLHAPHGDWALHHARHRRHPLDFVLWTVLCSRHLQVWRGLQLRLRPGIGGDATERQPARRSGAHHPSEQLDWGNLSLSGGRPASISESPICAPFRIGSWRAGC